MLIPVKRFEHAKRRLDGTLAAGPRAALARWLAGRVAAAARPWPTFVACDDDGVAAWAEGEGATVLWTPGVGLNGAIDASRTMIGGKGFDHLVVAHSDLPLAHRLGDLAAAGTVTLVPDGHRDGTNVMAMPVRAPIVACYGPRSFAAHLAAAMASGLRVEVRHDPRLSLDVDAASDLLHPALQRELPEWLVAILADGHR